MEKAFLGRITAGMTHEINNVWATIREAAGLMKDLMTAGADHPSPLADRVVHVCDRIGRQVERGSHLTNRLNRFAHSMDYPERDDDLAELVGLAVDLNQRFARLKKVELKALTGSSPQRATIASFRILLVLSTCLNWLLDFTKDGGEITLEAVQGADGLTVEAQARPISESSAAPDDQFDELAAGMNTILNDIGAEIKKRADADRFSILVNLKPRPRS